MNFLKMSLKEEKSKFKKDRYIVRDIIEEWMQNI
jgi:hypothetical protein